VAFSTQLLVVAGALYPRGPVHGSEHACPRQDSEKAVKRIDVAVRTHVVCWCEHAPR
jgi:hypothetical protein